MPMSEASQRPTNGDPIDSDPSEGPQEGAWAPCRGEIHALSRKLGGQRTRRRAVTTAAAVALVAGAIFSFGRFWNGPRFTPEVLACGEVKSYQPQYAAGGLDDNLRRNIDRHLDHCPQCRRYYENTGGRPRASDARTSLSAVL